MNILLVEDNEADADLLTELLLEAHGTLGVSWINDGRRALAFVARRPPYQDAPQADLILLDLGLPSLRGEEVLRALRGDPTHAAIPVIVLSTSSRESDRAECMQLGAVDYLCKPRDLGEYPQLIQRLLHRFAEVAPHG